MVRGGAREISAAIDPGLRCAVRLSVGVVALASMNLEPLAFFAGDDADCAVAPVRFEFSGLVGDQVAAANQVGDWNEM